jgi:hypothetical protein
MILNKVINYLNRKVLINYRINHQEGLYIIIKAQKIFKFINKIIFNKSFDNIMENNSKESNNKGTI